MSFELLTQLEAKVATTLDSLEILRMEMDELKEENITLKNEKSAWETRLGQLLGKFSELEPSAATPENAIQAKNEAQDLNNQKQEENEEGNNNNQEEDLLDLDSIN